MKTNIKHDKLDFLNAVTKVFIIGLVLTLMGGGTLLGMKIYEAFKIGLKYGIERTAAVLFIVGISIVFLSLIFGCIDVAKKDNNNEL